MGSTDGDLLASLMQARRLMLAQQLFQDKLKGKKVTAKSAREAMEEDQAFLSPEANQAQQTSQTNRTQNIGSAPQPIENIDIKLGDLTKQLDELRNASSSGSTGSTTITLQKKEIEIEFEYRRLEPVDGLVVRNANLAETDRYAFEFSTADRFKITDKWSGKSTTIWGDPHVDVSDVEGQNDGDFKDLQASNSHTSFMLQDGTQVTFTAEDAGIIEKVDILKGSQHLTGFGGASKAWADGQQYFESQVKNDASATTSRLPTGDVVHAGGDGNDWYDSFGRLVWGKTTSAAPSYRPTYYAELSIRQSFEQTTFQQSITKQA